MNKVNRYTLLNTQNDMIIRQELLERMKYAERYNQTMLIVHQDFKLAVDPDKLPLLRKALDDRTKQIHQIIKELVTTPINNHKTLE